MKIRDDVGDVLTYELTPADLRSAIVLRRVARDAKRGELVYVPLDTHALVRTHPGQPNEDSEPVKPRRPDPRRLDALRAALAARGKAIEDCGAFYHRIVSAAPAARSASLAGCAS